MKSRTDNGIGEIIRTRRVSIPLTLCELSIDSGVSQSHIGRIERGECFPSAHVLRMIAKPLGFKEEDLFMIAGFLSSPSNKQGNSPAHKSIRAIDPSVAIMLSHEPVEVQRAVIGILSLLKSLAKTSKTK